MPLRGRFQFDDVASGALLLVEGIDDARFCNAFLRQGLQQTAVQIAQVGGNANFRSFITVTLQAAEKLPDLRRLGIVTDADTDAMASFQRVRNALADAGFPAPRQVWETAQSGNLTVSIAVLPDGNAPGNLEGLCLRSIADAPLTACVDEYIACATAAGQEITELNKARLHAYLATAGSQPGLRLGEAAAAGVWDWQSPAFDQIRQFLLDLAGP